jgi:ubiquitin carboxyl-terminal hydrolase 16/45
LLVLFWWFLLVVLDWFQELMGKKVKKSRAPPKEKRVTTHSQKKVPLQSNPSLETVGDVVSVVKERKPCVHLEKGVDFSILSAKIGSSQPITCEDCGVEGKGSKGKGKHGKKKGGAAVDPKSDSRAIWVCLECGHYACGGVGLPTGAQSHTVRHIRQTRHRLVIHIEKPQLCWCFPCNTLIPVEKMDENDEHKDILSDIVKLIKGRSSEESSVDVEDIWFGSGSITSEIKAGSSVLIDSDGGGSYAVRGLVNLGNTCFFNSIMQNLLAMGRLRDYFFKLDASVGPLTVALKKLFIETKPEAGLKNVINPRSFFGCVCSKAPQVRGYQQHDSHEFLRCLLDGLSTEELGTRKENNSSKSDGISSNSGTFVDAVFGGQISSTVCCVECEHSSTVYEPFLDLSLPVPTKNPRPRKVQPVSRAKKTKLPPKKGGKTRPKLNKDADLLTAQSVSTPSTSNDISCQTRSIEPVAEKVMASSCDSAPLGSLITVAGEGASDSQNLLAGQAFENERVFENDVEQTSPLLENLTWLDYVEPGTVSDENDWTSQSNDISVAQDPENKDIYMNGVPVQASSESSSLICPLNEEPNPKPDTSVNYWEDEQPLQVQGTEVLLLPYKDESSTAGEIIKGEAEASSSVMGCGQDELDFDGFGDMFNEPEIAAEPTTRPSLGNKVAETGVVVGNSSESDPDEVDNTDSPVTVESCLAHFIKPEILSNENAWHCENCSKILRHQMLRAKKPVNTASAILMNGDERQIQNEQPHLDKNFSSPAEVGNLNNGHTGSDASPNATVESLVSHKRKMDCPKIENGQTGELNPVVSQWKEGNGEIKDALPEQSHSSGCYKTCRQESFSCQAVDSCSVHELGSMQYTTGKVQQNDSQLFAGGPEPEVSEDEEIDSKSVKVKRDATKRVLIYKAPPILTIHLKRFSQDARGRLSKLNGHVSFRETIDLRSYMDPRYFPNYIQCILNY